jgi:hypothetical protein
MNEVIELPRREIVVLEARRLEIIEVAQQGIPGADGAGTEDFNVDLVALYEAAKL